MAIFPNLELEKVVQTGDKTRLDGSKSFISKGEAAITAVEIEPEAGSGFISVFATKPSDWYLDWVYSGATRTVTVSVRVTTDGAPVTQTSDISVVTAADDYLFSSDGDLILIESDILKYVRAGRSSFLDFHRRAQKSIVDWFNRNNYRKSDGSKIEKGDFIDVDEIKEWAIFTTLAYIFNDMSNAINDIFEQKSKQYQSKAAQARDRGIVRLDLNSDNTVTNYEGKDLRSLRMDRR